MAAEAETPRTPQQIYEEYMNRLSFYFSKFDKFDIQSMSRTMNYIYMDYTSKQIELLDRQEKEIEKKEIEEELHKNVHYKLRKTELTTFISDFEYANLSALFFNKLDSILQSNIAPNNFIEECKHNNVKCSSNEKNKSRFNVSNIISFNETYSNIKYKNTNKSEKQERCKHCFKFSPNVAGIKLTNTMRNKKLINANMSKKLVTIYITLPHTTEQVKTSRIYTSIRDEIKQKYVNTGKTNAKLLHSIKLWHTDISDSNIIITYITNNLWKWINDISIRAERVQYEHLCYMLHWLLAIACPFQRGSAGFAKVMLNAALWKFGLPPVKETPEYARKTDWVAMFSPTFEEYYSMKDIMFEIDHIALQQIQLFAQQNQQLQEQQRLRQELQKQQIEQEPIQNEPNTNRGGKRKIKKTKKARKISK
jgi:hypothetical protein